MAGGYITRKVNGILDEKYCTVNNGKVIAPGYYSNAYRLKNISTKEFENLNKYAVNQEEDKFFEISALFFLLVDTYFVLLEQLSRAFDKDFQVFTSFRR